VIICRVINGPSDYVSVINYRMIKCRVIVTKPNGCLVMLIFQNNQHKLTLIMTAEADYDEKRAAAEMKKLMEKLSVLSPDERENVFKTGNILLLSPFHVEIFDFSLNLCLLVQR